MIDTKQRAKYILEEYANCYSQVDLEQIAKYLDEIKAKAYKEFAEEIFELFPNDKPNTVISRVTVKHILKEKVGENNE